MKTANIYEVGERVMIKARVENVSLENGQLKYTLRDEKASKTYGWVYGDRDIIPVPADEQEINTDNA